MQIASVTTLLQNNNKEAKCDEHKKKSYRTLRLDSQGREIDDKGNLIKSVGPVKTLVANVADEYASKKKDNPYLSHKAIKNDSEDLQSIPIDDRLKLANRDVKSKKAFQFVEAG